MQIAKLTIVIALVFWGFGITQAYAQLYISTEKRIDAFWSSTKEDWIVISEEATPTLFKFNEKMTMFEHTTTNISSTYYIKDYTYDEDNEEYHLNITSDVGNVYLMVIDINDNNLRFLYEKNGISYAVQHNIKSSWKEEE